MCDHGCGNLPRRRCRNGNLGSAHITDSYECLSFSLSIDPPLTSAILLRIAIRIMHSSVKIPQAGFTLFGEHELKMQMTDRAELERADDQVAGLSQFTTVLTSVSTPKRARGFQIPDGGTCQPGRKNTA